MKKIGRSHKMKTIEENAALFEEARLLRKKLKQNLYENANNIGYCSVNFRTISIENVYKRLIEKSKRERRRKK